MEIKGYRELTADEIDAINAIKELEAQCVEFINRLPADVDGRRVSLAKTNIEQGFMWLIKSVAKPTS